MHKTHKMELLPASLELMRQVDAFDITDEKRQRRYTVVPRSGNRAARRRADALDRKAAR